MTDIHGKHGKHGRDGARGPAGKDGLPGGDGPRGKSAFEVAVINGFDGTEQQWLDGLKGTDGTPGVKGDLGPRGPIGPRGPEGPIGPMPRHEWEGTELRFEMQPGVWGEFVDLKGEQGEKGQRGGGAFISGSGGAGVSNFLALTDTPSSYVGNGGLVVAVKNDESGLEFVFAPGGTGAGLPGGSAGDIQVNDGFGGFAALTLPADATKYYDGTGNFSTPAGGGTVTHTGGLNLNSIVLGNGTADIKVTTTGTGIVTALGVNVGSAGAPVLFNGAGGTPSSIGLANGTGLPVSGITASTSQALGVGSLELGHASDTTLTRVSAGVVAVEGATLATQSYVDNLVVGLLEFKGSTDCSSNPNYPPASKGDAYYVSVAGKIGGASGKSVEIGDVYVASADNAGGSEASVGTSWFVLEHNLVGALISGGPLGTPSSGTASNLTGLPVSTGISGLGTGVATALAVNVGTAGAPVVNGGALGTPSSGVGTNLTGTASGLTAGTVTTNANLTGDVTSVGNATTLATVNSNVGSFGSATQASVVTVNAKGLVTAASATTVTPAVGSVTGLGTGIATALGVNTGSAGAPVLFNGAGGTPSSLTLTNATGLPVAGITASTTQALGVGSIELGHASNTTLSQSAPGVLAVEGVDVLTTATGLPLSGGTLTGPITLGENTSIALDPAGSVDGKYSGITVTGTGGATIAFGDLITLDKDDSRWELVDISVAAAATGDARGILGMAVTSSTDGTAVTVLLHGIIRADANFPTLTIGAPVYATTSGDVTVTQPTTTDHVIRIIGYGLTGDEMYFNPGAVWTTHT